MSTETFFNLWNIAAPILLAILAWGAKKLADLINSKVKNEYLAGVLTRLDYAVLNAVKDTNQATVDAMKAANADGKLTKDEIAQVKKATLDKAKTYLDLHELAKILGLSSPSEVDDVINSRIESAVHDLNIAKKSANDNKAVGSP